MNRPPAPRDTWWAEHQKTCGGGYTKIKEPEDYGKKKPRKKDAVKVPVGGSGNQDIRDMLGAGGKEKAGGTSKPAPGKISSGAFVGRGFVLGEELKGKGKTDLRTKMLMAAEKRKESNERWSVGKSVRGTASSGQDSMRRHKKPRLDHDVECIIIGNSSSDDGIYLVSHRIGNPMIIYCFSLMMMMKPLLLSFVITNLLRKTSILWRMLFVWKIVVM